MSNHQTPASCIESLRASGYIVTRVEDVTSSRFISPRFKQLIDYSHEDYDMCQEPGCNEEAIAEDMDDVDLVGDGRLQACRLCLEHVLARLAR